MISVYFNYAHAIYIYQRFSARSFDLYGLCNLKHAIIPFIKLQGSHQKFSLRYAFSVLHLLPRKLRRWLGALDTHVVGVGVGGRGNQGHLCRLCGVGDKNFI